MRYIFAVFLVLLSAPAFAQDEDARMQTIHQIDLGKEESKSGDSYALMLFDVKKVKVPGSRAHIIFRQFAKRVRLEFEAAGIPKGKYKIGVINSGCPGSENRWNIVHEAIQESTFLATEKSLPKHALRKAPVAGQTVLQGMNVGLFQVKGKSSLLVDCKPIK